MVNPEILKREVKFLLFDLYGTVVDMQKGLTEFVTPFLQRAQWSGSPHRFVTWWRRTHFENSMINALCEQGHTSYRMIGERAVAHVMDRAGIAYTAEQVSWLVRCIEKLKPFDEVVESLEALKAAGYGLAVLSNGDCDMLDRAKGYIAFSFDNTISVQKAGYFKPHWKTYAKAKELLGVDYQSILFVANHSFDCVGAKSSGMRSCYVNRRGQPFGHWPEKPDLTVNDFKELAQKMVY